MLQSIPAFQSNQPRMIATFPRWTFVIIQVVGVNTLFLAETSHQLLMVADDGTVDALQIAAQNGIVQLWWLGDLWAAGNQAPGTVFKAFLGIPGNVTSSMNVGSGVSAYGIGPTGGPQGAEPYI
jgi:hypothetical protein